MYIYRRRRSRRASALITGLIFLPLGAIFSIIGFFLGLQTLAFLPGSISAQGQIVRCNMVSDADGSTTCQPTIRFVAQSGQTITFTASDSSDDYVQGNAVSVIYHAGNPVDARINSLATLWLLPLIFGGLGLIFFFTGLLIVLRAFLRRLL